MRRSAVIELQRFLAVILSLGCLTAAPPARVTRAVDSRQSVAIPGHVHRLAQPQFDQGPVDPAMPVNDVMLLLKLAPDQQADLDALMRDQQNPSSPQYRKWLTPEEFGARFGVRASDESKVAAWLASEGLQVDHHARGRNWIRFSGRAAQVSSALRTPLHTFRVDGHTRFANTNEPSVPEALADVVGGFVGLNDFPLQSFAKQVPPEYNSGASHFLTPEDFATIYNLSPLYAAGIDGTGQSIAVVGDSDVLLSDIRSFRTRYGLPANDPRMIPYSTTDPGFNSSELEGNLDLEWAGAVAPKATIYYVYGPNPFTAIIFAVEQNIAPIISVSYGTCETDFSQPIFRSIGQQANAQGITILVAAGDSGAAACNLNSNGPVATKGLAVSFPGALPEVTAVGGTQFAEGAGNYWSATNSATFGSALSYIPEAAWSESSIALGVAAGGGGASRIYPQPAWQTGPGVPNDGARHVPDVSLSAARHDAYYVNYLGANGGVYGTSASAPSMAGIVALLNQYQVSKGFQKSAGLGNINPQLYRLVQSAPAVFHDITSGDNIVPCAQGSPDCLTGSFGYPAGVGYDMATGLGSVDANALVTSWNTATAAVLVTLSSAAPALTLNDTIQLTATVAPAAGSGAPTGTVNFVLTNNSFSPLTLGAVALSKGSATLSVPLYQAQGTGTITFSAEYSGDAAFNAGGATLNVRVTLPPSSAGVAVVVPTQPINVWPQPADAQGLSWSTTLGLRELAGVPAILTGFTIDGQAQPLSQYFPSPNIPANGVLTAPLVLRNLPAPVTRTFGYTGVDASGQTWSRQVSVIFYQSPSYDYFTLTATPLTVTQNTAADPACQWSVQLNVDDQGGNGVSLLNGLFTGNGLDGLGANLTSKIQSVFGTAHLDAYGGLQGALCFAGATPGKSDQLFVGMNTGAFQEVTVSFAGPPANPAKLSASPDNLSMAAAVGKPAQATLAVNLSDKTQSWSASIFPANRTTSWLTASQLSGAGSGQIILTADGTGFEPGAYRATIVLQSPNAVPQFINVPVMFVLGGSTSGTAITGVVLYGSTTAVASPGTLFAMIGTNLADKILFAPPAPLEHSLDGVSVTVNGLAAPLFYVTPDVISFQVPYEAGAGPAVLGVNNKGEIAGYQIQIAPAAPGIIADANTVVTRGSYTTFYLSGLGDVSPALLTGFSPTTLIAANLPKPVLPLSVTVGGVPAFVQFAGIPTGLVGMGQVNILAPASTPTGSQQLVVTVGGAASPPVNVMVQ